METFFWQIIEIGSSDKRKRSLMNQEDAFPESSFFSFSSKFQTRLD